MRASWVSTCVVVGLAVVGGCSSSSTRPPVFNATADGGSLVLDVPATDLGRGEAGATDLGTTDLGATDAGAADATAPLSPRCTTDTVTGLARVGGVPVGPGSDLVALCDGTVLLGDRRTSEIVERHVTRGPGRRFALSAAPGAMALDEVSGLLYVALNAAASVARVNLETGVVTSIAVDSPALDVTVGAGGRVFALLTSTDSSHTPVAIIDGPAGAVVRTVQLGRDPLGAGLLASDGPGGQLLLGVADLSPSALYRVAFDADAGTLTLGQMRRTLGSNGLDLAVSPDGTRVAFSCGSGNGMGYTIFDVDSRNLDTSRGEWNTGAYPTSAVFSRDGQRLLATNRDDLILFNASTHAEIRRVEIDERACSAASVRRVALSRGGRLAFAFADCEADRSGGYLYWWVLPE